MTVREFEIYFHRLYLPLGMYDLRIVGDADEAEDVVQDAFIKAWQAVDGGAHIDNFKSFIYRTVRNGCINALRSRKPTVGPEMIPEADEEAVDTSERDARIWHAIDKLPEACRRIFLLSKRDGLGNQEIADELGISIKTVKNQLTKAYARLREDLSDGHKPFFLPFL